MGLFSKEEDYNVELKNAVDNWLNSNRKQRNKKQITKRIKKYAELKLKNESGFSNKQFRLLNDVIGKKNSKGMWYYATPILKLMHLSPEDFESQHNDEVIEKLTTDGISVSFPKIVEHTTNKAGSNAIKGGILFGLAGAAVGGIMGSNDKQVSRTTVRGGYGNLKVTDEGLVIRNNVETLRIEWENVEEMQGNVIYLVEGKHIRFYELPDSTIIAPIVNYKAKSQIERGGENG